MTHLSSISRLLFAALCSALFASSVLSSGCTLTMNYQQCSKDSDCPMTDGVAQFCTGDGLCIHDTPEDRLCTKTIPEDPPGDAVHIGALLDLREENGVPVELLRLRALELGVGQINDLVQLDGIPTLAIDVCNVGESPVDADNATRVLIEQRSVKAIIGPNSPSAAKLMIARVKAAGVPTISPAIMDTSTTSAASQGLFFFMAPVEAEQGLQMVRTLTAISGGKSTAQLSLISVATPYGENIRRKFTTEWQRKDTANKTDKFYSYNEGDAVNQQVVTEKAITDAPDYAVAIPGSDGTSLITALTKLPPANFITDPQKDLLESGTALLVSHSARSFGLLNLAKTGDAATRDHLERIRGVAPLSFINAQEGTDLQVSFKVAYPDLPIEQDLLVGYTYDSLLVIAAASASVRGASRPDQILAVLRRLNGTATSLSLTPRLFKESVQKLVQQPNDSFTLIGSTGAIRFRSDGGREPALLETWTVDVTNAHFKSVPVVM